MFKKITLTDNDGELGLGQFQVIDLYGTPHLVLVKSHTEMRGQRTVEVSLVPFEQEQVLPDGVMPGSFVRG